MVRLHRHQLAHLAPAAWQRLRERSVDAGEQACLALWQARSLPLVVTQQPCAVAAGEAQTLALGLSAPERWGRRRISVRVAPAEVMYFDEFPAASQLTAALPATARRAWIDLCETLRGLGVSARVYGSHGWQLISGMEHVRVGSDVDLWIGVTDAAQADQVVAALDAFAAEGPRLDGELVFHGDRAIAWREWQAWREGAARTMLVKTLGGPRMVRGIDELMAAETSGAPVVNEPGGAPERGPT